MQVSEMEWSVAEKTIAKSAFDRAYEREINALLTDVRERAGRILELKDVWHLHDFLSAKRHEIDGKYDDRDSMLIFVFADLVREGWLQLSELDGIHRDKIAKVGALSRM
jgi:hypothetical protein